MVLAPGAACLRVRALLVATVAVLLAGSATALPFLLPLSGFVVAIDAGHGGADPGATDDYQRRGVACPDLFGCPDEGALNLAAAQWARDILEWRGATVVMTRDSDETVSLASRVAMANDADADLFVSIHHNSGGGEGTETFYYGDGASYSVQGRALAQELQTRVTDALGTRDRGIHADQDWLGYHLYVLRFTRMPAALVEVAFMDDQSDYDTARGAAFDVGSAVADAVEARLT